MATVTNIPSVHEAWPLSNMLAFRKDPLAFIKTNQMRYGDLFRINLFGLRLIFLTDVEVFHQILVKDARRYYKPPRQKAGLGKFLGNGLIVSDGDFWRRQRQLAQPAFHTRRISAYAQTMVSHTLDMLEGWTDGQQRDIAQDMMHLTMRIVASTLFDVDVSRDATDVGEVLEVIVRRSNEFMNAIVNPPDWLPVPRNVESTRSVERLDRIILRIIDERRQSGEDRGDLMSMLLMAVDAEDGTGMTDQQLRDEVVTLFLAGHETTANTLTWAFALLSQNPDVEQRLVEEVQTVLAGRTPTLEDLPNLLYTERVIKETMRLYPAAWMIAREPQQDVELAGYDVEAHSILLMSIYHVHRDERNFPDPDRFDPDRFSPDRETEIPAHAYLPFSSGPRVCIGNSFAMLEAHLLLATIISRYHLSIIPGHVVEEDPLVTLRPRGGMPMTLSERVPIQQRELVGY